MEYVYVVSRCDYDDYSDDAKETLHIIGIHRTAKSANEAARRHCMKQAQHAPEYADRPEHGMKNGLYVGSVSVREDERDHYEVTVERWHVSNNGRTDWESDLEEDESEDERTQTKNRNHSKELYAGKPAVREAKQPEKKRKVDAMSSK